MELIAADGGLNKQWIRILFAGEHHVYGASEGSWRIFLRFLLKAKEDFTQDFIGNLKYMGPFCWQDVRRRGCYCNVCL